MNCYITPFWFDPNSKSFINVIQWNSDLGQFSTITLWANLHVWWYDMLEHNITFLNKSKNNCSPSSSKTNCTFSSFQHCYNVTVLHLNINVLKAFCLDFRKCGSNQVMETLSVKMKSMSGIWKRRSSMTNLSAVTNINITPEISKPMLPAK